MAEIISAVSARELKAFFAFSEACGYTAQEAEYLRLYANPTLNPIRTAKREYIYLMSEGRIAGRLLTWKDDARDIAVGASTGFFSLCDALTPECGMLLERMLELQKKWGSKRIIGPVSPDGSGFLNGMAETDNKAEFCTPVMPVNMPEQFGFECCSEQYSYSFSIPTVSKVYEAGNSAMDRFGLKVSDMKRSLFSDPLPRIVTELSMVSDDRRIARQAERIAPYVRRSCSFAAYSYDGKCQGYLITLNGHTPRVTTLITGGSVYTGATVCALLTRAGQVFLKQGIENVDVGVIDSVNLRSLKLAENVGCVKNNCYRCYSFNIY